MRDVRSDDEVLELGAVSVALSAEEVSEDGNDDIVGVVSGVLDDSVGEEEDNSDILEAVGSEEEGNTVPFNDISEDGLGLVGVALVKHGLSLLKEGENFNLEGEVLVLNSLRCTVLSSSSLASISGLMRSSTLATQESCRARASYFSMAPALTITARMQARMKTFIVLIS